MPKWKGKHPRVRIIIRAGDLIRAGNHNRIVMDTGNYSDFYGADESAPGIGISSVAGVSSPAGGA